MGNMRFTAEEKSWVEYMLSTGSTQTAEEIVKGLRRVNRNASAKSARRAAHIERHGYASAQRYYTGI